MFTLYYYRAVDAQKPNEAVAFAFDVIAESSEEAQQIVRGDPDVKDMLLFEILASGEERKGPSRIIMKGEVRPYQRR